MRILEKVEKLEKLEKRKLKYEEYQRYARQLILGEIGLIGQEAIGRFYFKNIYENLKKIYKKRFNKINKLYSEYFK